MGMQLRPYQEEAKNAVIYDWEVEGHQRTLLVLPTGCGKTIVFSKIVEDQVKKGYRVLILAHRGELLDQAADKLFSATGLRCGMEKAEDTCIGSWFRVVVGSVQSLMREKRLSKFSKDYFGTIVIDEAHHCLSDGYQRVLQHFDSANVLGVTATPDRGDKRDLGQFFENLAYEYTLPKAIQEGYLTPIEALTIPLQLDLTGVGVQSGDFKAGDLGTALDPYLEQIAQEMEKACADRKTVVFLPLVKTSQKFRDLLNQHGFRAAEVNGTSEDRAQILQDFDKGRYNVLCNSMLLTEGWDCPSVDCVVVLRPTKVRALYCLDEQTEVLTPDGWKKDVDVGESVAAFDVKTSKICFLPALAKIRRPLNSDEYFCSIKSQSADIRVTNKHRMVYDNKRRSGWKIKAAEQLAEMTSGCYIPVSGFGKFSGVPLTADELRFIGWVMTDGSINKSNGAITITQGEHQPWLESIQGCINGCGFKYNRFIRKRDSQYKSNSDCVVWTISKGAPRGRDKDKRGWGALEPFLSKDVSPRLFDMTEEQFDIMLEAIHLGDGHKQHSDHWTQHSYHISKGNKTFIETLQRMAVLRGYRASVAEDRDINKNIIWTLHAKKQTFVNVGARYGDRPSWVREIHTEESCWCVENKLGTLVTRRNGKVAIVGNCQMVGRGTRLSQGKENLLLLDFLWHTERHELCRPAHLICENPEVAEKAAENLEAAGCPVDLEKAVETATQDVIEQREKSLAKQLAEMRSKKRRLVDPIQFEMSIQEEDLSGYVPAFGWEMGPATAQQQKLLESKGISADDVECAGKAKLILDKLRKRQEEGLTTPKQIRCLEKYGFQHVGKWQFYEAKKMIDRIAAAGWRGAPRGINPAAYTPGRDGNHGENEPANPTAVH